MTKVVLDANIWDKLAADELARERIRSLCEAAVLRSLSLTRYFSSSRQVRSREYQIGFLPTLFPIASRFRPLETGFARLDASENGCPCFRSAPSVSWPMVH